jgi:hypothetical protein
MQPFSKLVSVLSIAAAVFGALNTSAILSLVSPQIGSVIVVLATLTAALSHSLQGTGGTPSNP